MTNPLLDFSGLAQFDAIKPEHVTPAIDELLAKSRAVVQQLEAPLDQVTWDNFVTPLENATELLGRAWGIVSHLNNVVDTPELRATYNDNQPKVTEFWTALAQGPELECQATVRRCGIRLLEKQVRHRRQRRIQNRCR